MSANPHYSTCRKRPQRKERRVTSNALPDRRREAVARRADVRALRQEAAIYQEKR